MWKPVLVVAKNFVRSPGIQHWQLVDAAKYVLQLAAEDVTPPMLFEPLQSLF